MTRKEALKLCYEYDGEFPDYYLEDVLEYLDLSKEEFLDIVDKHRNDEIWKKNSSGKWQLRFPLPDITSCE